MFRVENLGNSFPSPETGAEVNLKKIYRLRPGNNTFGVLQEHWKLSRQKMLPEEKFEVELDT